MDDQIDFLLDILVDRSRLWPIYRYVIRLSDFPAVPCRVLLLFMEARHRGIWTSQMRARPDSVPLADLGQVPDGLSQLDDALDRVRSVIGSGRILIDREFHSDSTGGEASPGVSGG